MRKSYGFRTFRCLDLRSIPLLANYPSRNRPTNSFDEPRFLSHEYTRMHTDRIRSGLAGDRDNRRRPPRQKPVDAPPQPHHAIIEPHLVQPQPRALENSPADEPGRPGDAIEADDLLHLQAHPFQLALQLRL